MICSVFHADSIAKQIREKRPDFNIVIPKLPKITFLKSINKRGAV